MAFLVVAASSWAQGAPEFTNISVSPEPFSPNGDGIKDQTVVSYELSDDADWVIVAVKDSLDALVVTLIDGLPQQAGVTHQLAWDGRDASSSHAPDGKYTIRFASGNSIGQDDRTWMVGLDSTRPTVELFELSPNPFTPDLPGSPDSLTVRLLVSDSNTLETPDSLTVAVGPAGSAPGDTLTLTPEFAGDGEYAAHWKAVGREDGSYEVHASIADAAGNSSSDRTPFALDTSAPLVGITDPKDGTVFKDLPDSVFGRAYDPAGIEGVEIRYDSGGFFPVSFAAVGDTALWGAVLSDSIPGAGEHTIEVRAMDNLGHIGSGGDLEGPSAITVTRDIEAPPVPTLDPTPESVRTETLDVTGSAPEAVEVSLFINDLETPAIVVDASIGGFFGATLTLQPGLNMIAASATDAAGNSSELGPSVTVEYVREFGVFFNERFRPGDSFEISLEEPAQEVTIALYAISGRLVRVLSEDGPSKNFSIKWDGSDDAGAGANNGVYLCTVRAVLQSGLEIADKKLVALVR